MVWLSFLQSLANADGVDGDGELVHNDNEENQDGEGDAGQDDEPASGGAPRLGGGDDNGDGRAAAGKGLLPVLVVDLILEAAAVAELAGGDVVGEGISEAKEAEERSHDGDDHDEHQREKDNAEDGHAGDEQELVADGGREQEGEHQQEETRDDQGDQGESLSESEDGSLAIVVIVVSEAAVGGAVVPGLGLGGEAVKSPELLGGVDLRLVDASAAIAKAAVELKRIAVPINGSRGNQETQKDRERQASAKVKLGEPVLSHCRSCQPGHPA
mmetsp:Transcript_135819/g.202016  ORF Transcript_135819/g.202016 Transcript_135819/m.202016 type:complete len:271 (+) Transcript_135819:89-901(+)